MALRRGARTPERVVCTVAAKVSPVSKTRRLPFDTRTTRRLGESRVMIIPAPKASPPRTRLTGWQRRRSAGRPHVEATYQRQDLDRHQRVPNVRSQIETSSPA